MEAISHKVFGLLLNKRSASFYADLLFFYARKLQKLIIHYSAGFQYCLNEPGHIYIRLWSEPEMIVLEVEDDGVGMSEEQLQQVHSSLSNWKDDLESDHGFGLRNVHQRIQLYYGEEYGLMMSSMEGYGTTVNIRLPISQE
ncbi:putative sensor-like histidine kinase [compost metagenome]